MILYRVELWFKFFELLLHDFEGIKHEEFVGVVKFEGFWDGIMEMTRYRGGLELN